MSLVYQIQNWDQLFENNKSRTVDQCRFVCVPNKQDGMGLTRVLTQPNGLKIYGIWHLILGACSRQRRPRAGWMTDNGHQTGTAWTLSDLSVRWRCQVTDISEAVEFLSLPNVGWIKGFQQPENEVSARCPLGVRSVSGDGHRREGMKEEKEGNEGEGKENTPPPIPTPELAHIPSEAEFLDAFMPDGIPIDYLRKQWVWFDGNNAWLDQHNHIKKWKVIVRGRWASDRMKWGQKEAAVNGNGKPKGTWEIKTIMEAKQEKLDSLRNAYAEQNDAGEYRWPAEAKEQANQARTLKAEIAALKNQLAEVKA